jgi:hypothetical protein
MRFVSLFGGIVALVAAGATSAAVTPVNVKIGDARSTLSRTTVPVGIVAFAVSNVGHKPHAFSIAGRTTQRLAPGKELALKVTFAVPAPTRITARAAACSTSSSRHQPRRRLPFRARRPRVLRRLRSHAGAHRRRPSG